MRLDDGVLTQLLLRADPARTPRDARPDARAVVLRERILATSLRFTPGHRLRRWVLLAAPAFALAALLAVVLPFSTGKAIAMTPAPLSYTTDGETLDGVLTSARTELATTGAGDSPLRESLSEGWYLQVDTLPDGSSTVAIAPQITALVWNADLSGTLTITAAEPYWASGEPGAVDEAAAPVAGTVLRAETFSAADGAVPEMAPPGADAESILAALRTVGLPEQYDSADLFLAIGQLFQFWTLTDQQQGVLWDLVEASGDVRVLGESADRENREVTGLQAAPTDTHKLSLLVSVETGRIVGLETALTNAQGDVPAGSIVSYTLWDLEEE